MGLPKLATPVYEIELPVSKTKLKFRPFLVKEQKLLLLASETSDDPKFIRENIVQVIKNCSLSEKVDIDSLPSIDIEFLFLNLRARSVGENVELNYRCEKELSDGDICNNKLTLNVDLLDIKVDLNGYEDIIKLTDSVGLKMKPPGLEVIEKLLDENKTILDKTIDSIIGSIEYIYDNDNFHYPKEVSRQEIVDFLEGLSFEQFKKIETYYLAIPKLKKEYNVTCSKCGFEHKIALEGLQSFLE